MGHRAAIESHFVLYETVSAFLATCKVKMLNKMVDCNTMRKTHHAL